MNTISDNEVLELLQDLPIKDVVVLWNKYCHLTKDRYSIVFKMSSFNKYFEYEEPLEIISQIDRYFDEEDDYYHYCEDSGTYMSFSTFDIPAILPEFIANNLHLFKRNKCLLPLFDKIMNNQLNDISITYGIDIDRLKLVFSRIKANGYLGTQEARQFVAMGINILGELADKFSKVEGMAVSVDEVCKRTFKGKISLEDVQDVFNRIIC